MQIRQAESGDLQAIQAIVDKAYSPYIERMGRRPGPMQDDYALRIDSGEAWVAEYGGAVVGVLVLLDQSDSLLIDNIAVAPVVQGKRIGRAILDFAIGQARERGNTEIQLYTHRTMTENIEWYERHGFQEIRRVREQGFERVYMRLSVPADGSPT